MKYYIFTKTNSVFGSKPIKAYRKLEDAIETYRVMIKKRDYEVLTLIADFCSDSTSIKNYRPVIKIYIPGIPTYPYLPLYYWDIYMDDEPEIIKGTNSVASNGFTHTFSTNVDAVKQYNTFLSENESARFNYIIDKDSIEVTSTGLDMLYKDKKRHMKHFKIYTNLGVEV